LDVNQIVLFGNHIISELSNFLEKVKSPLKKYILDDFQIDIQAIKLDSIEEEEVRDFLDDIIFMFLDDSFYQLEEFDSLRKEIRRKYGKNFNDYIRNQMWDYYQNEDPDIISGSIIHSFAYLVLSKKVKGILTDNLLTSYASILMSELNLAKNEFDYYLFLSGIEFEKEQIIINDEAEITKYDKIKTKLKDTHSPYFKSKIFRRKKQPVLHINVLGFNRFDSSISKFGLVNALYLYKLGEVRISGEYHEKKTVMDIEDESDFSTDDTRNSLKFEPINVNKTHEDSFVDFIKNLSKIISLGYIESETMKPDSTIYLALERYVWALHDNVDFNRKLMNAVMGLEPLFTVADERGENSYKIAMRAARLLRNLGLQNNIYNDIRDAYTIRNAVVHGGSIKEDLSNRLEEIFGNVLNYLRLSLIIFFLKYKKKKKDFILMINNSMLDEKDNEKLKSFIKDIKTKYKDSIYDFNKESMWDRQYYYF